MKKHSISIQDFSPHLFWDLKPGTAGLDKNQDLIVERVIQRGSRKDLELLLEVYDRELISKIIRGINWLSEKDLAFVHVYFDIPLNEMKCCIGKQSARYC